MLPRRKATHAVVAALAAGIVLYLIDAPAKSAYFRENLPHTVLKGWPLAHVVKTPDENDLKISDENYYYLILDQNVPAGVRARALYMGSIYRIGWESVYLVAFSSTAVLVAASLGVGTDHHASRDALYAVFSAMGLAYVLLVAFAVRADRARIKYRHREGDPGSILETMRMQCGGKTAAFIGFGVALVVVGALTSGTATSVVRPVAIALLLTVAGTRYMRGYRTAGGTKGIWELPAVLMLAFASISSCAYLAFDSPRVATVSLGAEVGWAALNLIAAILVVARGHEKRLGGGHATVRNWLALNRQELEATYGERPTPPHGAASE